jgi:hypothetical protein
MILQQYCELQSTDAGTQHTSESTQLTACSQQDTAQQHTAAYSSIQQHTAAGHSADVARSGEEVKEGQPGGTRKTLNIRFFEFRFDILSEFRIRNPNPTPVVDNQSTTADLVPPNGGIIFS